MQFKDIIGHSELKAMLVKGVDSGRVSHAQMFTGGVGYGTLPMAMAYAQYVNCTDREQGDSCGVCSSCVKIGQLVHPDLHFVFPVNSPKSSGTQKPVSDMFLTQWREIYAKTGGYFSEQEWYRSINIDNQQGIISRNEANEVIRKLSLKAFEARYKIVVIWLPEKMRTEAANGLLKILEEPWEMTLFLLVSEAPQQLLPTILSRVQEIAVPSIATKDMEAFLVEKYGMGAEELEATVRLSRGDLLQAQMLMDSKEEGAGSEFFELFSQLMRLSYNNRHMELLEWGDSAAALGREEQKRLLQYSIYMLRENYMLNAGMNNITYLWGEELEFSRRFSPFIGNHNIERLVEEMERAIREVGQNGNPRIIFPHMALEVSKLIVKL